MTDTITKPEATRAVAIINAAMKHGMFPQGAIPESDGDKIVEAEKLVELAKQARAVADQVGKQNVPNYQAIVDVLFEAEVTQGTGGNGNAAEELPGAPPAGEEESAAAETKASAPPSAAGSPEEVDVGTISVLDKPQTNERIYTHHGCDGGESSWMVPLDDCPPPKSTATKYGRGASEPRSTATELRRMAPSSTCTPRT
jgi:hypothetical protein